MGRRPVYWTPAEDDALRAVYTSRGVPAACRATGRTQGAVVRRARILGLPTPPRPAGVRWSPADIQTVRDMYPTSGLNATCAATGRTRGGVAGIAKKLGLAAPAKDAHWTPAADARLRDMHARGMPDADIAAALGEGRTAVRNRRRRLGLPTLPIVTPYTRDRVARKLATAHAAAYAKFDCDSWYGLIKAGRDRFAAGYGLPPEAGVNGTRIVVALAAGPLTRAGICERLGRKNGPFYSGLPGGGRRSTLIHLAELGLVTPMHRNKPGGSPAEPLYMLTGAAMERLASAPANTEASHV